jgi:hypothetical protein
MDLVYIESSKVIYLNAVYRPQGQVYMPELLTELIGRYNFLKFPTPDQILKREIAFNIGKFQDIQIQDFNIYIDGIIVSSASDTDKLMAFINDVFSWARDKFGVIPTVVDKPETYFESTLIVKSDCDLANAVTPKGDISGMVGRAFNKANSMEADFIPTGIIVDMDAHGFGGRRRPMHFTIERKLGVPFEDNVFYCRAPVPTKAHLELLRAVEDLAHS